MENNTTQKNIKDEVLHKIIAGEICMKPKARFVWKLALLILIVILALVISIILISYTLFSLYVSGYLFLLGFGSKGIYEFVLNFPWLLMSADAVLIIFLDYLLKHFRFGYNNPVLYLFVGTFFITGLLGSIINLTSFHNNLLRRAEQKNLPLLGGFYQGLRKSHVDTGTYRGTVISIDGNVFSMKPHEYDTELEYSLITVVSPISVIVSTTLNVDDEVFVAGNMVNGAIEAYGIRKLDSNR